MTEQHEKKNTAEKIDGSIDKADRAFDNKVNEGINKAEGFIAKHARVYNLSGNTVRIGGIVIGLIGVYNVYEAMMVFSLRYYPMGTWLKFIFGALLVCIAVAAWRASKQLDGTRTPTPTAKPVAKEVAAEQSPATRDEAADTPKSRDVWWVVYAASAALALFIMMKPATNTLVQTLHGSAAAFSWGWIVGMAAYSWYRFQGGKWTLSISGFPLTFLIVLIDIGLIFVLFS